MRERGSEEVTPGRGMLGDSDKAGGARRDAREGEMTFGGWCRDA